MAHYDVIIIGAGASGLFCAGELNHSGLKVAVLEKNKKPGKKILISGGGRCNFTNKIVTSKEFLSKNEHFSKSALSRYAADDFVELVKKSNIPFYEKKLGQLFCKQSAKDILNLLLNRINNCDLYYEQEVIAINQTQDENIFKINSANKEFTANKVVIASGGLSIPPIGISDLGYKYAKKTYHKLVETHPALVGFVLEKPFPLSGISLPVEIIPANKNAPIIVDDLLFTHKGLSGPAILKASLYWNHGEELAINLLPGQSIEQLCSQNSNKNIFKKLKEFLPNKLVDHISLEFKHLSEKDIANLSKADISDLSEYIHSFKVIPQKTEGYKKAEVTKGGVSTSDISSKTMESKKIKNLFFVGEVIDVTGLLGGYNFQWAWSSAFVCAQEIQSA